MKVLLLTDAGSKEPVLLPCNRFVFADVIADDGPITRVWYQTTDDEVRDVYVHDTPEEIADQIESPAKSILAHLGVRTRVMEAAFAAAVGGEIRGEPDKDLVAFGPHEVEQIAHTDERVKLRFLGNSRPDTWFVRADVTLVPVMSEEGRPKRASIFPFAGGLLYMATFTQVAASADSFKPAAPDGQGSFSDERAS